MTTSKIENSAVQLASASNVRNIWGGIIINVKAYGAIGDGIQDDTIAIQRAINYAISTGQTVITFPTGTYLYGTLTNTSGLTFVGDGVTLNGGTTLTLTSISLLQASAENFNNLISSLTKRLQNGEVTKIKLIGDSITEGYGATGHVNTAVNTDNGNPVILNDGAGSIYYEALYTDPSWANFFRTWTSANFPTVNFVNAGIGGKTTTFALANKQYWVGTEDVVFVMLGTNDKYNTPSIATYKSELSQFLAYVKAHCNTMIVMTPPPAADDFDSVGVKNTWNYYTTADIDRVITEVCNENKYSHISHYRELLDYCKVSGFRVNHLSAFADSHPNDFAHDLMWTAIQNAVGISDNKRWMVSKQTVMPQLLIDSSFQVAQSFPVVGTAVNNPAFYTYPVFDMWKLEGLLGGGDALPTTITHKQVKITDSGAPADAVPGSKYCCRVTVNGAGTTANSQYNLVQLIENGLSKYCPGNRWLYASFWARSSIPNKKLGCGAYFDYGTGGSPSPQDFPAGYEADLTNTWSEYSFVIPVPSIVGKTFGTNQNDFIAFRFLVAGSFQNFVGSGDIEMTEVQLSTFASCPYPVKTYEEELRNCQRYLWKPTGTVLIRMAGYNANEMYFGAVPTTSPMRSTPAILGTPNTHIIVSTLTASSQTGFTFSLENDGSSVRITATKSAHGLTDGYLIIKLDSGLDARL